MQFSYLYKVYIKMNSVVFNLKWYYWYNRSHITAVYFDQNLSRKNSRNIYITLSRLSKDVACEMN
jgi:hypothetical protein